MTNLNIIANTSWRDISTAPKDGTVFLAWGTLHERGESMCERPYWEVVFWLGGDAGCWFSPASGRIDGLTKWRPLPPPPGEEGEGELDIYKLSFDEVVRHKDDQIKALQARCDKLEAAARGFLEAHPSKRSTKVPALRSVVDGGE